MDVGPEILPAERQSSRRRCYYLLNFAQIFHEIKIFSDMNGEEGFKPRTPWISDRGRFTDSPVLIRSKAFVERVFFLKPNKTLQYEN